MGNAGLGEAQAAIKIAGRNTLDLGHHARSSRTRGLLNKRPLTLRGGSGLREDTVATLCWVQSKMGQETKQQCLEKSFLQAAHMALSSSPPGGVPHPPQASSCKRWRQ